ncbi:LON peptidase substrate-binding domain-containing protein, partial [Mycobacterium tuberculosis]|nr:LON peptidase substrate-binding domain-containing protein [Mycobacterium tuberculosis]
MQDDVLMTNPESSESQEFTTLPLLALRDVVVYPQMQIALFVGRTPSVKAVELAQNEFDNKVLVVAQKDSLSEDIDASNLFEYGT